MPAAPPEAPAVQPHLDVPPDHHPSRVLPDDKPVVPEDPLLRITAAAGLAALSVTTLAACGDHATSDADRVRATLASFHRHLLDADGEDARERDTGFSVRGAHHGLLLCRVDR